MFTNLQCRDIQQICKYPAIFGSEAISLNSLYLVTVFSCCWCFMVYIACLPSAMKMSVGFYFMFPFPAAVYTPQNFLVRLLVGCMYLSLRYYHSFSLWCGGGVCGDPLAIAFGHLVWLWVVCFGLFLC